MKFDPNIPNLRHRSQTHVRSSIFCLLIGLFANVSATAHASDKARLLAARTIERLVYGDAFDAKLRQRVWVGGREIIGVGQYEQAGSGTGYYMMDLSIHDGDTKQSLRQLSDGRLTWTRTQIGSEISIGRVDLGRIDEYERDKQPLSAVLPRSASTNRLVSQPNTTDQLQSGKSGPVPARFRVGGLVELIDSITRDYDLVLKRGTVERQPVWILHGRLSQTARQRIEKASGRPTWAALCPVEVRVAVAATADATGFGAGLPLRVEYWSEPQADPNQALNATEDEAVETDSDAPRGRLISTLEIYETRRIKPQSDDHFRFESDDVQVTFINETKSYLDRL